MATPIRAIPTLYGKEAERLRKEIEEVEEEFEKGPQRDITKDEGYQIMLKIIEKSKRNRHLFY